MRGARAPRERLVTPAFLIVSFACVAYFISIGMVLPVLPRFVTGPLGGSEFHVGLVAGIFSVSAVLLRPLAGHLGDRRGRRPLVLGGGALAAVSILGYGLASNIVLIVALRLLNGVGEAFFFTGAATAIADIAPEARRGEAVSFFSLAVFAGIGLGPLAGEALLERADFGAVWIAAGLLAALAVVIAFRMPDARSDTPAESHSFKLLHPKAVLPGSVLALLIWGFAGFSAFMPLLALSIGMEGSRFVFLTYAAVIIVIRSAGARIPDLLGPGRTATVAAILSGIGLVVIGFARGEPALFASAALFATGQALCFPALLSLALAGVSASERSSVIGSFTAFFDVAFGAGPLTLGVVAELGGLRSVFWVSAAMALVGLTVLRSSRLAGRPTP
ncbi:MAG TPA: MFS transporter [Actinomycetota bacterium]|nr:MFS transporter [Actinomycetota bacterium]